MAIISILIRKVHGIGLVKATVCDQGTQKVNVIKMLLEANHDCKRCGEENKSFGFVIDGKEVLAHLLKGIPKNLYQYGHCQFKYKNGYQTVYKRNVH